MENNLILVTDWVKVDKDDFYLTDDWSKSEDIESIKRARELQEKGELYEAYLVDAKKYAIYWQLDADSVYIDNSGDVVIHCEGAVISNDHKHREEYNI